MKRALALLAVIVIPGAAIVAGLAAAWRYCFQHEDMLDPDGPTMRRIRHDEELARSAREQEEMPRGRRVVLDRPAPSKALSRPWGRA